MRLQVFDTVSEAINALTLQGYKEDYRTGDDDIVASYTNLHYAPHQLTILETYRFEGCTDPQDEATIFAIVADDGTKGTLIMSNSAEHNHDTSLLRQLKVKQDH